MSRYSVVQTGPNTQLGGVKEGFTRWAYQVGMAGKVAKDPMAPAKREMLMENMRVEKRTLFIHFNITGLVSKNTCIFLFNSFYNEQILFS
jgi:hypothetical protein